MVINRDKKEGKNSSTTTHYITADVADFKSAKSFIYLLLFVCPETDAGIWCRFGRAGTQQRRTGSALAKQLPVFFPHEPEKQKLVHGSSEQICVCVCACGFFFNTTWGEKGQQSSSSTPP